MTAEQIIDLVLGLFGIVAVVVIMFFFFKYVLPLMHEESKDETGRQLVKARAEAKQLKKLNKYLLNELVWGEIEISNDLPEKDELAEGLTAVTLKEEEDVEEILGKD